MKTPGYLILTVATLASLVFAQALKPSGLWAAIFISVWLSLPYIALALVLHYGTSTRVSVKATVAVVVVVAAAGLLLLADIVYLHPDPQGAIAVLFLPVYQGFGIGVFLPLSRWLFGKLSA